MTRYFEDANGTNYVRDLMGVLGFGDGLAQLRGVVP